MTEGSRERLNRPEAWLQEVLAPLVRRVSRWEQGDDANEGTSSDKAWKTIDRINKVQLCPGDSVLLEGGKSFDGNMLVTHSGTTSAFIAIGSYGTGAASIRAGASYAIRLLNCQYVKVSHDGDFQRCSLACRRQMQLWRVLAQVIKPVLIACSWPAPGFRERPKG
jgi:hypothetical protein